jgi:hypothetical protein
MELRLTEEERRRLRAIVKAGKAGRKTHKYFRARTLLALDRGLPAPELQKLLSVGLIRVKPSGQEKQKEDQFDQELDYVLRKNAELYRRLAR